MKACFIFILLLLNHFNAISSNDTCKFSLTITKTAFSQHISNFEEKIKDSAYDKLTECEKITIIRLLNTISLYKEIYTNTRYKEFWKNVIGAGWLIRIINDLGAVYEGVETPFPHERYNFQKYQVFFEGCDYNNSAFTIKGLKREKNCTFTTKDPGVAIVGVDSIQL